MASWRSIAANIGRTGNGRSVGRSVDRCYTYVYCEEKKRGEESKGAASVASRMRRAGGREGERVGERGDGRRSCCRCDEQGSINEVEERSGERSGSERANERLASEALRSERTRMAKEILDTHASERKATKPAVSKNYRGDNWRKRGSVVTWNGGGHRMRAELRTLLFCH